jgi:site-specific DNA-methyltransferase (adenine-specific)
MKNRIINGDCTEVLKTIAAESVDFVLTDPPYFVRYKDRSGRTIRNDRDPSSVLGVFDEVYRVLKPDSLCISFYGWQAVDAFMQAWKSAGFTPVGHIVWHKSYASNARFLQYCHEQAYVLAKGRPSLPAEPLSDVQPWKYSGNRSHPTEKSVDILKPLITAFTQPGQVVLDPFAGSGSTLAAAALAGRNYLSVELEAKYCELIDRRLAGISRYMRAAA